MFNTVLHVMGRQASLDAHVEDAKSLMPADFELEAVFGSLDRFHKGYVADSDLWQLVQDFGGSTPFGCLCTLVHEVQLRRHYEKVVLPGRLSLREVGTLLFKLGTNEYEAMGAAHSDNEAKSILHLLKHSEPCPSCGMRVQRDGDSAGCPTVTCPSCAASFRCHIVVGDAPHTAAQSTPLSVSTQYQLNRLVDVAARAADDLDRDRKKLTTLPGYDVSTLSDIFNHISDGQLSFKIEDLRRTFLVQSIPITEHELNVLWHRFAPSKGEHNEGKVTFPDFARQLKPF